MILLGHTFDGDEMNAHIPQSYEAATELEQIAAVRHQIIGPREGKPSIGIVQDTLVGSYRLTKNDNQFTRREFMNLMMYNKNFEGIPKPAASAAAVPGGERWSGHQVISSLLPPINMDMGNKSFDDDPSPKNKVKIVEGQVLNGIIDKDIFSKAGKGIVHVSYNDYGSDSTVTMIDSLQTTIESFLVLNGFSVGISDMIADEKTRQQMEEVIQSRKKEVNELNLQVHLDLFDNNTGKSNQDEFEARVFAALNKATKESGEFGQLALAEENRLVAMVKAGSKGGPINIAQMIACVGQQNIEGRRIPYGFSDRTLPHYKKYDDGPEARGFIESSFIGGLSPQEFFFHAMSGREGLIDTAVKSVTGDTPIIIIENGEVKRVEIGPWIDAHLKTAPVGVIEQYDESQANLELLNITHDVTIPTVDADGKMSWGKITAITRHDPGNKIYEIKTHSGREVIVSAGKSMLVWNNSTSKFEEKPTTETKIGDYVPVTVSLPEPPVIQMKVELSKYLPKSKYVYGSDFVKAQTMMAATMDGRKKIPAGWWEANNGKTFTLPYPSKARFQRTQVRSDITQIESGYVYPFHASREISKTPEIFELTHENGIFLGLFLAEGNVDVQTGYVQITNNDSKILEFVKSWFTKRGLSTSEDSKTNKVGGTSSCVRGFSSIFAQFLDAFVGHGAEKKFIPSEAFIAPEEFITGLLNGYFSGDGCVGDGVVSAGSASKRLITGISVLCSRLGIFGRIRKTQLKTNNFGTINILPSYIIEIRSKWAKLFAQKIPMIHNNKQKKLENISTSFEHRNFPSHNDIVLDAITEINEMSTENYPKLYDLTIPSTFNFVLENGHGTRDTADTGYIQRQLVKAMEDLTVQHDGTVRDANMHIVQFHYGEDGLNATKIEGTGISYAKLSEGDISRDFGLQKVDFAPILSEGVLTENYSENADVKGYLEHILKDRKMIVEGVFGSGRQGGVFAPLNPERLIMNLRVRFGLKPDGKTDLTPTYVIQGLNKLMERTQPYHKLWCALIRFHFAPHKLIVKERFTKAAFDALMELCVVKDWKAWSLPGELVGIIAAQSIGEPSTQMTLNTFHLAGVAAKSNVTRGVPRLKELLKVTENPKAIALTVYLKPEFRENKDKVREVTQDLELTLLRDITVKTGIFFDPEDGSTVVSEDKELIDFYKLFEAREEEPKDTGGSEEEQGAAAATAKWSNWLLRLELDRERMFNKNISMDDISFALHHSFGTNFQESSVNLIYSDFNSKKLVMRIRLGNDDKSLGFGDDLAGLKKFQNKILNSIVIRGVPGIRAATFRKHADLLAHVGGEYKPIEQYVIDTDGTNFMEVMNHPAVDGSRIYSTHVHDIYSLLGIEATRACLLSELIGLFEEAGVNYRHLGILCDIMTRNGRLMSIDRYGINKSDNGPLAKASFEETEKILLKAALFGEVDPITGVSANIMTGQAIRAGTSFTQILLDESAQERLLQGLPPVEEDAADAQEEEAVDLSQEMIDAELYEDSNDACATTQLRMNITMPQDQPQLDEPDGELVILEA